MSDIEALVAGLERVLDAGCGHSLRHHGVLVLSSQFFDLLDSFNELLGFGSELTVCLLELPLQELSEFAMKRCFIAEVRLIAHIIILLVILFTHHFGEILPRCRAKARIHCLTHFFVIYTCEGCRICLLHHLLYFLFHVEVGATQMVVLLRVRCQILSID